MAGQCKELRADKTERGVSFWQRGESEETVPSSLPPNFFPALSLGAAIHNVNACNRLCSQAKLK